MRHTRWSSILLITLSLASLTWAGQQGPTPANVGQVDLVQDWSCPQTYPYFPNDGQVPTFTPMPFAVSVTTMGGPVLLSLTMTTHGNGQMAEMRVRPLVDQVDIGAEVTRQGTYLDMATLTRVISLPAGTHSFGATIACMVSGNPFVVTRAWLTVYELPSVSAR